jgi:NAD+ kinase
VRLFVVANLEKYRVRPALDELLPWLKERVQIVGVETNGADDLSSVDADAILVMGGDGTLLSVARRLGSRQIPLLGINFGRLGFLSSFTPAEFREQFQTLLDEGFPVRSRLMLEASVIGAGASLRASESAEVARRRRFVATALNDAVITAGPPFHMIELEISADSETGVRYFGDGVIISTASGSTAYNVSAGGPIINADVDCLCITPICPHSLSFRPVVIGAGSTVLVHAVRVNEGTTIFCDGQASTKLSAGEKVIIRRAPQDALLIENPHARGWQALAEKLNWAIGPKYNRPG